MMLCLMLLISIVIMNNAEEFNIDEADGWNAFTQAVKTVSGLEDEEKGL